MDGPDLERAVAAPLQARGWFVLRNAQDPTLQAFEVDVLSYRFSADGERSLMVESKGGKKSRFHELWKLLGLKTHLKIDRGVLLANAEDAQHEDKVRIGAGHDITVIDRDPAMIAEALREAHLIDAVPTDEIIGGWERCYRVEDGLIEVLRDPTLWKSFSTIRKAKEQLHEVIARVWIDPDPWSQAARLYALYQDEPKIARTMAEEMAPDNVKRVFDDALLGGKHPQVQACLYLEHRKRIAVAFAATRCAACQPEPAPGAPRTPDSFKDMVKVIRDREAWELPALLQVYFLGLGGVIRTNAEDEEYVLLAEHVGCSSDDARELLALFNELFPTDAGWFYDANQLSRLKLMPVPIRGAGLRMRENVNGVEWAQMATEPQMKYCGTECLTAADELEGGYKAPRLQLMARRVTKRVRQHS